ncbi:MAG: redoxin domain-containing protein [bacterium]|nr:redoxin domain-containing protein [bacterium]
MIKILVTLLLVGLISANAVSQEIKLYDVVSEKDVKFPMYGKSGLSLVIFTSNVCPYSEYYKDRIKDLYDQCESIGIQLVLVNSNSSEVKPEESTELMKKQSLDEEFSFPYLADKEQLAQKTLDAKKNPEAFLIKKSNQSLEVLYRGSIDDNPRSEKGVRQNYLESAIKKALEGKSSESTHAFGCSIKN